MRENFLKIYKEYMTMTNPAKSRNSFIFLTLILFYYSDEDILNSTPAF